MFIKPLRIIAVGKLRLDFWRTASAYYLERLSRWRNITETIIRDAPAGLASDQRAMVESLRIAEALSKEDVPVCLDEKGINMDSRSFSRFLADLSSNSSARPCFIVGGPYGLRRPALERCRYCISFGRQTLPHEMARVLLLEQLYRAETISRNIPYHHD